LGGAQGGVKNRKTVIVPPQECERVSKKSKKSPEGERRGTRKTKNCWPNAHPPNGEKKD